MPGLLLALIVLLALSIFLPGGQERQRVGSIFKLDQPSSAGRVGRALAAIAMHRAGHGTAWRINISKIRLNQQLSVLARPAACPDSLARSQHLSFREAGEAAGRQYFQARSTLFQRAEWAEQPLPCTGPGMARPGGLILV